MKRLVFWNHRDIDVYFLYGYEKQQQRDSFISLVFPLIVLYLSDGILYVFMFNLCVC